LTPLATGEIVTQDGVISAPITGGSTTLIEAVRALDAQSIVVDDIALRRPTLDDVFLSLTGHSAEDEAPPAPGRGRRRGPVRR
jgi:ABC-2 type transport system ATP-binding protein